MGWGNESLLKWSRSHDQYGRHAHIIMVKTLKIFSGTKRPMTLKLSMQHQLLEYYQFYSNDNPGLTLTFFMVRTNLLLYSSVWGHTLTVDFQESIDVYDLKIGT